MRVLPGAVAYVLVLLSLRAMAEEPVKHQLSSFPEYPRKYQTHFFAISRNGVECVWGHRKDLNPETPPSDQLLLFDRNTLQVWPLASKQIGERLAGSSGMVGATFDSSGTKLAVTPCFRRAPENVMSYDIVLIDLRPMDCDALVSDGCMNFNPSFSPDGRYIAYYATDRRTNPMRDNNMPLNENAGRIVNVRTKQITSVTNYIVVPVPTFYICDEGFYRFGPPQWLDKDRVLFSAVSNDRALIHKYIEDFSGTHCSYAAVANATTGEVKRLFLPGRNPMRAAGVQSVVDNGAKRLYFSDHKQIVQTDFDLTSPTVIAAVGEKEMFSGWWVENGQVKYFKQPLPPK